MPFLPRFALAVLIGLAFMPAPASAQQKPIIVFAAASLKNALDEANARFTKDSGIKAIASYAASPALMRQIEHGAPADVFLSADLAWMDYGVAKNLVRADTRTDLLGNRLVLIAPADTKIATIAIAPGLDLAGLAGGGRIVTGDVKAVPAGRYAKAALEHLGLWQAAEKRIASVENVRAALTLVARAEAALGIVYATDAKAEPRVKVVGTFPEDSHPPIVYPAALTPGAGPEAARYLAFLRSEEARAIFEAHGFSFLAKPVTRSSLDASFRGAGLSPRARNP